MIIDRAFARLNQCIEHKVKYLKSKTFEVSGDIIVNISYLVGYPPADPLQREIDYDSTAIDGFDFSQVVIKQIEE